MTNLSKSVRAALDGWYANEARGQTLDAWLEERLGPVGAVVTDVVREVDATHGEVTQASDRYRWLAGRIAGLRARVGDDTVDRLLGEETEASLAHAAIDGAAGALRAIQGEVLPALDAREVPPYASALADFFERPNGDRLDADVVRVVAVPVIERLGGRDALRPLVGVTVAGLDAGIRLVKAAVRVGLNRDRLGDAVEWAVDRAAAAAAVAVEKAAEEGGAKLGAAVGGWLGSFVGAAHVGAALGAHVGRMAGARVGSAIASGVRAVAKEVEDRKLERPVGEHIPTRYTLLARARKPFEAPKAVLQDRERWKFGAQGAAPPFRPRARLVRYASRTSTVRPRPVDPSTATTRSTPGS